MNEKLEVAIQETIREAVDESLRSIMFNLGNVFGGLLYSLKLENEKQGGVGDIDTLIRMIVQTSKYDGPEDEPYPVWDEKKCRDIIKRLETVLLKHGIEQSWNIGRNFQKTKK